MEFDFSLFKKIFFSMFLVLFVLIPYIIKVEESRDLR